MERLIKKGDRKYKDEVFNKIKTSIDKGNTTIRSISKDSGLAMQTVQDYKSSGLIDGLSSNQKNKSKCSFLDFNNLFDLFSVAENIDTKIEYNGTKVILDYLVLDLSVGFLRLNDKITKENFVEVSKTIKDKKGWSLLPLLETQIESKKDSPPFSFPIGRDLSIQENYKLNEEYKLKYPVLNNKIAGFQSRGYKVYPFSIIDVIDRFGENPICYLSGEELDYNDKDSYRLDHVIPVARGGSNGIENMGILSHKMNVRKNATLLIDLLREDYIE